MMVKMARTRINYAVWQIIHAANANDSHVDLHIDYGGVTEINGVVLFEQEFVCLVFYIAQEEV